MLDTVQHEPQRPYCYLLMKMASNGLAEERQSLDELTRSNNLAPWHHHTDRMPTAIQHRHVHTFSYLLIKMASIEMPAKNDVGVLARREGLLQIVAEQPRTNLGAQAKERSSRGAITLCVKLRQQIASKVGGAKTGSRPRVTETGQNRNLAGEGGNDKSGVSRAEKISTAKSCLQQAPFD